MLRKLTAAGFVAGAAMGVMLMAAPAHAGGVDEVDVDYTSVQECQTNEGVVNLAISILSEQEGGHCINGPVISD